MFDVQCTGTLNVLPDRGVTESIEAVSQDSLSLWLLYKRLRCRALAMIIVESFVNPRLPELGTHYSDASTCDYFRYKKSQRLHSTVW